MSELNETQTSYQAFNVERSLQHMEQTLRMAGFDLQSLPKEDLVRGYVFVFPDDQMIESGQYLLVTDESRIIFYLNVRGQISTVHFPEVVEYITRANNSMPIGNFEADYDRRRVRFRSSADFGGIDMPNHLYRQIVLTSLDTVAVYIHGLMDVRSGHISAKSAIERAQTEASGT